MKYRYIGLVGLLAVLSVSLVGPAEAFLPGMPSLGGWSCAPAHKANCSVDGELGYLGYPHAFVFQRDAFGPNFGFTTLHLEYPVEGLWVAASAAGSGPQRGFSAYDDGDGLCLSLRASWLVPNNKDATETDTVPAFGSRTWRPTTQWYTLDGSVSTCATTNFSLFGGFRFDSFATKFADPSNILGLNSTPADEAELSLLSYIPYLGAVTKWGAAEVGVISFPWVQGTITHGVTFNRFRETATGNYRNAYFLETWAAFGGQLGIVNLSAFATYTLLHAVGEVDYTANVAPLTASYSWGFDRQNWIVGGKLVVGLNSPL